MGKCMLWKTMASYVYIAYPKEATRKFKVLEAFGIGLLSVSEDSVDEMIRILPEGKSSYAPFKVTELHPVNHEKQSELYKQVKRHLEV
jgi:predicted Fe-Mo cluster-binding NifX family protein